MTYKTTWDQAGQPSGPCSWDGITGKPSVFPPSTHNHDALYSLLSHHHDASYAGINHNHAGVYAPVAHNHDALYAPLDHSHPGGSGPVMLKVKNEQTSANQTLVDIAGSALPVTSGNYYRFIYEIVFRTATNTTGPRVTVSVPAFSVFTAKVVAPIAADGAANEFRGEITASNDPCIVTAFPAINTDYLVKVEGVLVPSANGNIVARFANETGTTIVTMRRAFGMLWDFGT